MEKLTQKQLYAKHHDACEEIEKFRKKYAAKRSSGLKIIQKLIYKKHKLFVPFSYGESGNYFELWCLIKALLGKAFFQGRITERLAKPGTGEKCSHICGICEIPIELGEIVVRYAYGEFTKDEIGGIGFEEPQSMNTLGYAHIVCLETAEKK